MVNFQFSMLNVQFSMGNGGGKWTGFWMNGVGLVLKGLKIKNILKKKFIIDIELNCWKYE